MSEYIIEFADGHAESVEASDMPEVFAKLKSLGYPKKFTHIFKRVSYFELILKAKK